MGLRQYKYGEVVNSSPTNASAINYNNALTHLAAGNMQGAMDELYFAVAGAINKNVYTEEELLIGSYLGKPLYQKVIPFGGASSSGIVTNIGDNTYIKQFIDARALADNEGSVTSVYLQKEGKTSIKAWCSEGASTSNKLIIQYTKTTD